MQPGSIEKLKEVTASARIEEVEERITETKAKLAELETTRDLLLESEDRVVGVRPNRRNAQTCTGPETIEERRAVVTRFFELHGDDRAAYLRELGIGLSTVYTWRTRYGHREPDDQEEE